MTVHSFSTQDKTEQLC